MSGTDEFDMVGLELKAVDSPLSDTDEFGRHDYESQTEDSALSDTEDFDQMQRRNFQCQS